jgi:hypothetical protein
VASGTSEGVQIIAAYGPKALALATLLLMVVDLRLRPPPDVRADV